MSSSPRAEAQLETCLTQQRTATDLGRRALADDADLAALLGDACTAVVETLGTNAAVAYRADDEADRLTRRASAGLPDGDATPTDRDGPLGGVLTDDGPLGRALSGDGPVVADRLSSPAPGEATDECDASTVVAAAIGPREDPWGVLVTYATDADAVAEHDVAFVENVATVLGPAVDAPGPDRGAVKADAVADRLESEAREIFGRVSDAFFALDRDWNFTYLNDRAHELINPEGRDLVGKRVWDEFPAGARRSFKSEYERAMREQETVSFEEHYPEPLDTWFEVRAYPSETGLSVYFQDITDRKERERELEKSEQRYRALVENFPNGAVALVDRDLRYRTVGGTPVDRSLDSAEQLEGQHVRDALSTDLADAIEPLYRAALDGESNTLEYEHDGTHSRIRVFPVRDDDGDVFAAMGMSQDVTDLRERERELMRYEAIVSAVGDGVYVVDEEGRFTMVNDAYAEMIGYDREELLGEHVSRVVDGSVVERARDVESKLRERAADAPVVEAELKRKDGSRLPAEATFGLLPGESGEERRVGVVRDVSDRKERERELERKERRYEAVFEDPNILVGLLDPDGTVLNINQTAMEYIDADLEGVTGQDFWDTPWWGEGEEIREEVREWTERAAAGEYVDFEADLTRPDGTRYTISGSFRPVTDDDGEVVSIIVSDRDITERRRRERQLAESERRYRALVEYFPNGLVTLFDHDLVYDLAAGQGFDRIPVEPEDLEGESFREVWDDETADALEPAFQAALSGEERSIELSYAGRRWSFTAVPITDERGDVFAGMTMAQDITERTERERELRRAKAELEAATEAGSVGTWEWYVPEDRFVAGPWLADQFDVEPGAANEGVSLDRFVESIHEDDRERVEAEIEDAVDRCGEYETEYRVWDADDELRWVVARGHVECDDDGEPVRFPGAVTDITERKRAEMQLQRTNEQLETLFEVLPVGVVVADADGRIVEANDTAKEVWGGDVFDADSVDEYRKYPIQWADSGEAVDPEEMTLARVLDGQQVTEPDIFEIETVDGERRIVRVEGMPVRDGSGAVTRGVVTLTDITERKETERQLEESERRYRTLVENFPNGAVGLFDENLEYTVVGGQLVDRLDVDPDERVGNSITEIHPEEFLSEIEPYFRDALAGETSSFDLTYRGRELHAITLPVRSADEDVFAGMLVVQDVTERKEHERQLEELVEKLEESNERLEQFAYAASHDLQEPLRMVSSYLQLIERRYGDELDEDGEEFLEFAVDGADRMRDMIDGLLKYSRVDTRGEPLTPLDLDAVVADVRDDLKMKIEESDAEITVEDLPRVEGDAGQLRQVFQNLLDNAIEYSGDDPPRIRISAKRAVDEVVVSVSDEGIGIDPEDAERVFEVFQSLHAHAEHCGTGIGLALCERIVERHGGDIWVESEPGEGATFSLTLPAAGDTDE